MGDGETGRRGDGETGATSCPTKRHPLTPSPLLPVTPSTPCPGGRWTPCAPSRASACRSKTCVRPLQGRNGFIAADRGRRSAAPLTLRSLALPPAIIFIPSGDIVRVGSHSPSLTGGL